MSTLTRGNLLDRMASILGDTSTEFRTYMETSFNHVLFTLFDAHDWDWKHKTGQFVTVAGQESYDLSNIKRIYHGLVTGGPFEAGDIITGGTSTATGRVMYAASTYTLYVALTGTFIASEVITGGTPLGTTTTLTAPESGAANVGDLRSAQDIEVLYDTTNGKWIQKVDLRDIRKRWPKEDTSGKPSIYAPWGDKTIILSDEPDAAYTMKFLYLAKATKSTSDNDDLESTLGIPDYVHYLFEKMLLAEAMLKYDDNRRAAMLAEIGTPQVVNSLMFNAVQADMKHLESGARFKFWEEELGASGVSFNDFLRATWSNAGI